MADLSTHDKIVKAVALAATVAVHLLEKPCYSTKFNPNRTDHIPVIFTALRSENNNEPIRKRKRSYTKFVPSCTDDTFKTHFGVSKSTVECVIKMLVNTRGESTVVGRPKSPIKKTVLLGIWTLANQESFRSIADRFDVGTSHAYREFTVFCYLLHNVCHDYIKWPSSQEAIQVMQEFKEIRGFPRVMGAMDSTHIYIKSPEVDSENYLNSKGFHSVILQAVCKPNLTFTDVFVGWPGCVDDAYVWDKNPLRAKLKENLNLLPNDSHLVGSAAYPLDSILITPFRDDGFLTEKQRYFNDAHQATRWPIEGAFQHLKGRFKRLKYLDMSKLNLIPKVVTAACVLHNMCMIERDMEGYDIDADTLPIVDADMSSNPLGIRKQSLIADYLLTVM